jgi:predicted DNA-binding transcriptional regulator AlpA
MENNDKYVTIKELAGACGVTRQRIFQCVQEGKIKPDLSLGATYAFTRKRANAFMGKYFSK